jgi:hypothetical protein
MSDIKLKLPDDTHIFHMTDDTGMFQHSKYSVPDPSEGYTTDDNVRALMMTVMLYETTKDTKYLDLIYRYLSFLLYAGQGAWFRNFMDYSHCFTEEKGSQDCFGRCIWCLGYTVSRPGLPAGIHKAAQSILKRAVPGCNQLKFLRSKAYAVLGLSLWNQKEIQEVSLKMAVDIAAHEKNFGDGWNWFEDSITYCNAVLPLSMLAAYEVSGDKKFLKTGLESLDFLLKNTFENDVFHPVGCNGWYQKGKERAEFDQQPVEAYETLLACLKAGELTGNTMYMERAKSCLDWYTGKNILGISLIDSDTGGCMDGITSKGCNGNEGAESLIAWITASLAWQDAARKKQ